MSRLNKVIVRRVDGAPDLLGQFVALPWSIYPGKHAWVPPFRAELAAELGRDNPFFAHGDAALFAALVGDAVVGRISASTDRRHDVHDASVGHFGYFECIDDGEVAGALLEEAERWLRARGKTAVQGPVNWTIYQGYRLQTDGFTTEPWIGEPRNPRYYARLLEQAGYAPFRVWGSYDVPGPAVRELIPQLEAAAAKHEPEFAGYTFEPFDPAQAARDLRSIHKLFMDAFSTNYGFYEASVPEYVGYNAMSARTLSYANSFMVRDARGELVAFTRSQKNPIEAFLEADGDSSRLPAWPDTNRRVVIQHTTAVRPDVQGGGLLYKMGVRSLRQLLDAGFENWAVALVKEGRTFMDRVAPVNRRYALFHKRLSA